MLPIIVHLFLHKMHVKIKGVDGSLWDLEKDIVYDKKTGVMRRNKNTFTRSGVEHYANDIITPYQTKKSHTILIILFCVLIAICLLPFVLGYRLPYSSNATTGILTQRR